MRALLVAAALAAAGASTHAASKPPSGGKRPDDGRVWGVSMRRSCPSVSALEALDAGCLLKLNKPLGQVIDLAKEWHFRTAVVPSPSDVELRVELLAVDHAGSRVFGDVDVCVWRSSVGALSAESRALAAAKADALPEPLEARSAHADAHAEGKKCLGVRSVLLGNGATRYSVALPADPLDLAAEPEAAWRVTVAARSKTAARFLISAHSAAAAADLTAEEEALVVAQPEPRRLQIPSAITLLINQRLCCQQVNIGTSSYYTVTVPLPFPKRLDVTVSPAAGDPDLYVTLDGSRPSTSNRAYYSTSQSGVDIVVMRPGDLGAGQVANSPCNATSGTCTVNIAVYGFSSARYAITVSNAAGAIPLTSGSPFVDYVGGGFTDFNYYSLQSQINTGQPTFSFIVTPFAGDPDLFVGSSTANQTTPNFTAACWGSQTNRRDVVEVDPTDTTLGPGCYCSGTGCTYYAGVMGWLGPATYSILATEDTAGGIDTLVDGVIQAGFVAQGSTAQYTFTIPGQTNAAAMRRVRLVASPISGDPDIYVTLDGSAPGPTRPSAYSSISGSGPETITMLSTDPQWAGTPCANATNDCTIRIAVYGFSSTLYVLLASSGAPFTLSDGVSLPGYADGSGALTYYNFQSLNDTEIITISVTPLSGDPDLWVGNDAFPGTVPPSPNAGGFVWRSTGTGTELVNIDPTDPKRCKAPCWYSIGVGGFNGNASYIIRAATKTGLPVPLSPGEPIADRVEQGTYNRYVALFDRSLGYLELTVTPLYGDPDLYAALDNRTVTYSNYQWASKASDGDEDILISNADARFKASCAPIPGIPQARQPPCVASIAVYGFTPAGYTITASAGVRMLLDGVSTVGRVKARQYSYFTFTATNPGPWTLTVNPTAGDADVYVSNLPSNPRPNATYPFYQWVANGLGLELLTIDPADPQAAWCPLPCTYYVGVYGFTPSTQTAFQITAASVGTAGQLADGQATYTRLVPASASGSSSAVAPQLSYFSFNAPAGSSDPASVGLEFSVAPIGTDASDAVLYVGNDVDPVTGQTYYPTPACSDPACTTWTMQHASWSSASSLTRREVVIPPTDPGFLAPATYMVAIFSSTGGRAAVMAATGNASKVLTDDVPYQESLPRTAYSFFRFPMSSGDFGSDVTITVTPLSGDPDLYVSFHADNTRPGRSPARSSDKYSTGTTGAEQITVFWSENTECQAALADPSGSCSIYLSVYAYTATAYTILAEATINGTDPSAGGVMLEDGVPQAGSVARGAITYFYAPVSIPYGRSYSVYVRALSGDPDVYATTDGSLPTVSPPNWQFFSANSVSDDFINIQPGARGYNSSTTLRIGVFGFTNASFLITFATSAAVGELAAGRASIGSTPRFQSVYYSIAVPDPTQTLTLSLTALSGDPDLFVSVWPPSNPSFRPSQYIGGYTWSSTVFGSDSVTIPPSDPSACTSACSYIMAVYCASSAACRFALTGSLSGGSGPLPWSPISLVDGQPLSYMVSAPRGIAYFSFSADPGKGLSNVTFTLAYSGRAGRIRLYITNTWTPSEDGSGGVLPTPTNASSYIWTDSNLGGRVTIPFTDPNWRYNAQTYTIAVAAGPYFTPGNISFAITATQAGDTVTLLPGQPSPPAYLPAGSQQLFQVAMDDPSQDLIFIATPLFGGVTIAVSYTDFAMQCTGPTSCPGATWLAQAGSDGTILRISAPPSSNDDDSSVSLAVGQGSSLGPCNNPFVVGPCDPSAAWRTGSYYVAVFAPIATAYTLTAATGAAFIVLDDGLPEAGETAFGIVPVFNYRTSDVDQTFPDLRLSFAIDATADGSPLQYFINSCTDAFCASTSASPGPGNAQDSGILPSGAALDVFVTKFSPAYCAPILGSTCNFFISVWPTGQGCTAPGTGAPIACPGAFTISAEMQSGMSRTPVLNQWIDNKVFSLPGNVEYGDSALVELYLNATAAPDVTLELEACGPGYPTLYVCNPVDATGARCTSPVTPGPGPNGNTQSVSTMPSSPGSPAVGILRDFDVAYPVYFAAVTADGQLAAEEAVAARMAGKAPASAAPAGQAAPSTTNWNYFLSISSGNAVYLRAPTVSTLSAVPVDSEGGLSVNVSWTPPIFVNQRGVVLTAPVGVQYTVFAAAGGFTPGSNPNGVIPTTNCGLQRWSQLTESADPTPAASLDATWAVVGGLQPNTAYEFNVVASCDQYCMAASGFLPTPKPNPFNPGGKTQAQPAAEAAEAAPSKGEAEAESARAAEAAAASHPATGKYTAEGQQRKGWTKARAAATGARKASAAAQAPEAAPGLRVPGYNTQFVAYSVASATTGSGLPAATSSSMPVSGWVGISFGMLAVAACGYAVYRYRAARAAAGAHQYSSLDVSGAMSTISTPPPSGMVSLQSAPSGGGSGFLGKLRDMVGSGGSGGGKYGKAALADTEYSELDDRASGFL